ncbi:MULTISPECIES: TIGR01777 family oxidoreductase [unclassified Microbacterium]|uniref:TIGR01777 family oxidoreductase n=1 Tax=unclassified Microbacterium TaxID=2609290 RepID=UPI002469954C|nr:MULTISPECIES: TIGR01777 family oxidoreductase [unclassified Microbacterium]MDH5132314.1 TIGR01777 family oxidoreductase [Microbacterium sp. RD10]MDH5135387.1 TIGR01777 family oxidoreductase [Microbacterium sp. RD11]MDH5143707.1 TIGR01777 family oxidoreductase [Microbacterium sp. RD12]MDH5154165.1 TIGR01777 family oxidoreductase [Microbacterium sp. RD06]MDH5164667.1 TIGR01777 family oxidoreductase [Microbacterium sp. RD02]
MERRIVISGASGLIGSALTDALRADGIDVSTLVRRAPQAEGEVEWAPGDAALDPDVLAGAEAVVALGGASVGRLPWTRRYRRQLVESRLDATNTLTTALRALRTDAPAFVSASAVGYYGSAPGEVLTEHSGPGSTFLADLTVRWETAARRAEDHTRVALLRTAPVIHRRGVLRPMITLTKLGVAGPLGTGTQIWPWISLEDEVRGIRHVLDEKLAGPVNLAGPTRASANEIGRALAQRMHRPFWLPAPRWALRLALGDAAESLLLPDADVRPEVLEQSGFRFTHRTAAEAVAAAV